MGTTIKAFIEKHHIRIDSRMVDSNPNFNDEAHVRFSHYRVTLKMGRRQMSLPFSHGPAICHDPEVSNVLDCLLSDASSVDNCGGFEDWAAELGMDTDSRKAERVYRATVKQSAKLRAFLGDLYDTAINCERE